MKQLVITIAIGRSGQNNIARTKIGEGGLVPNGIKSDEKCYDV